MSDIIVSDHCASFQREVANEAEHKCSYSAWALFGENPRIIDRSQSGVQSTRITHDRKKQHKRGLGGGGGWGGVIKQDRN